MTAETQVPDGRRRLLAIILASALLVALIGAVSLPSSALALPCRDCGPGGEDTSGPGPTGPNTAPIASFTVSPSSPAVGQLVTYNSTSTDEENNLSRYEWDLDGDGVFE